MYNEYSGGTYYVRKFFGAGIIKSNMSQEFHISIVSQDICYEIYKYF